MRLEKRLRAYGRSDAAPAVGGLERAIEGAKRAYRAGEAEECIGFTEFIYQQGRYIRKRWWVLQGAVLLMLYLVVGAAGGNEYAQRCMGVLSPLFVLLILPELWKNRSAGAVEVECAALYSLRRVYAARMILFALADVLLLSAFFAAAGGRLGLKGVMVDFLIPFNVTCCICFGTLCSRRIGSAYPAMLLGVAWIAVWSLLLSRRAIYDAIAAPVWGGLLLLSLSYMIYAVRRAMCECENIWEVNPIWD